MAPRFFLGRRGGGGRGVLGRGRGPPGCPAGAPAGEGSGEGAHRLGEGVQLVLEAALLELALETALVELALAGGGPEARALPVAPLLPPPPLEQLVMVVPPALDMWRGGGGGGRAPTSRFLYSLLQLRHSPRCSWGLRCGEGERVRGSGE